MQNHKFTRKKKHQVISGERKVVKIDEKTSVVVPASMSEDDAREHYWLNHKSYPKPDLRHTSVPEDLPEPDTEDSCDDDFVREDD
ncbi:MAG: hypothetical protein ABSA76_06215 [Bacteroidales bacterium]